MKRQAIIFFLFYFLVFNYCFSQDTLKNNSKNKISLSFYFTPSIIYLEPGISIRYSINERNSFFLTYGFQTIAYNFNNNDDHEFLSFNLKPGEGHGHIFKAGYRSLLYKRKNRAKFFEFRLSYKDLSFSPYYHTDDSPGLTLSYWYRQSEKRKVYMMYACFTSEILNLKYFTIDFTGITGVARAHYEYIRYSSGPSWDIDSHNHSPPEIKKESLWRPSLGVGFTLNFKVYGH